MKLSKFKDEEDFVETLIVNADETRISYPAHSAEDFQTTSTGIQTAVDGIMYISVFRKWGDVNKYDLPKYTFVLL